VTEIGRDGNWKMDGVHDRNGGSCDSAEHWCTAWRRAACRQAMMGAGTSFVCLKEREEGGSE